MLRMTCYKIPVLYVVIYSSSRSTIYTCIGLHRTKFENHTVTFKEHCEKEHNMWHYLYFIVHLRMKEKTELTGPESYVYNQIKGYIENKVI